MADLLNETIAGELVKNVTSKPGSLGGTAIAYSSLVVMALIPIFFGSFRSVMHLKKLKEKGEKPDVMSHKDAALFPFIASGALLGLYIFFKIFSKEYIDLLVTVYFFILGVLALTHILSPLTNRIVPDSMSIPHQLIYSKGSKDQKEEVIKFDFNTKDLVSLTLCCAVGFSYLWKKHWVVNNLFGLAFALNGVELLHLNNIVIGCTLLGGLFIYDIFWVFGTDVMVTVARSFEAPIKLVFPQDILVNWLDGGNFAMLGLGDIVIPGIFIALLLRFDISLKRGNNLYFNTSFFAYFLGLVITIVIMSYFKHAQPALLYLVPACVGTPVCVATLKGDLKELFSYEDHPIDEINQEDDSEVPVEGSDQNSITDNKMTSDDFDKEVKKDK